MALIKLTAIVDNISGKLNGTVFARNKGGHYMRSKSNPTNPRTAAQMAVRARFGLVSAAWRSLSETLRNAWNAAAADFPYSNRLGDRKTLSGFALHQQLNTNLEIIGAPPLSAPPMPETVSAIASLSASVSPARFRVAADLDAEMATAKIVFFATPPLSPGVKNFNTRLKQIAVVEATEVTTGVPVDLSSEYTGMFGSPVVGSKIGIKAVVISPTSGQASAENIADIIVEED